MKRYIYLLVVCLFMFMFWVPTQAQTSSDVNPKFFDGARTTLFVVNVVSAAADTYTVCAGYSEAKEFHNKFLFTDNCKGVAFQNGLTTFASVSLEYILFKTDHKKLARFIQPLAISKNGYSLYYTFKHK